MVYYKNSGFVVFFIKYYVLIDIKINVYFLKKIV